MAETGNDDIKNVVDGNGNADSFLLGAGNGTPGESGSFIDPAAATRTGTDAGSSGGTGKRGRPKGSTNKTSKSTKKTSVDLGPFSACILGIHSMLASISRTPELELDEGESEKLAKASAAVMRHYVELDVSQKAADWTNLFLALGGIYGPRLVARKFRKQAEHAAHRQHAQQTQQQQAQQQPRPAGGGAPNVGASVVHFPVPLTMPVGGGDFGGSGGGPGVG